MQDDEMDKVPEGRMWRLRCDMLGVTLFLGANDWTESQIDAITYSNQSHLIEFALDNAQTVPGGDGKQLVFSFERSREKVITETVWETE